MMEPWGLLASFTKSLDIGTNPASLLWIIPLTASIAIVYKATKVGSIKAWPFAKECSLLFASILVFITVAALVLCGIAWFFNDMLPVLRGIAV